jgi:uncharacterized circularly permuted ATP-grasp superfamily protein
MSHILPKELPFNQRYQSTRSFLDELYQSNYVVHTGPIMTEKLFSEATKPTKFIEFDVSLGDVNRHWAIKVIKDKNGSIWVDRNSKNYSYAKFAPPLTTAGLEEYWKSKTAEAK